MNRPNDAFSRRQFLTITTGAAVAGSLSVPALAAHDDVLETKAPFKLAPLPYAFDALEDHIDAKTMEIHHDKHHAAYVKNLNDALAASVDASKSSLADLLAGLGKLDEKLKAPVRNNGGGHFNHTFFWNIMAKPGGKNVGGEPKGKIGDAITKAFGSFAEFKTKFGEAGAKRFGSGWAWLVRKSDGSLAVTSTPNQDNPLMKGTVADADLGAPLLGLDVWEHAYYLKYQNKRPDYIAAWWNVVNWEAVEEHFTAK